jgi:hypothetical protein
MLAVAVDFHLEAHHSLLELQVDSLLVVQHNLQQHLAQVSRLQQQHKLLQCLLEQCHSLQVVFHLVALVLCLEKHLASLWKVQLLNLHPPLASLLVVHLLSLHPPLASLLVVHLLSLQQFQELDFH